MEVEVVDEVEGHFLPLSCLLEKTHHFGMDLYIVHGGFGNEILRACVFCFSVSEKLSLTKFEVSICKL